MFATILLLSLLAHGAADDLLLRNARLVGPDARPGTALALAIQDGRIVRIGDADACRAALGESVLEVDLDGRIVVRGFVDGHARLAAAPLPGLEVDLRDVASEQDLLNRVQAHVATLEPGTWVRGGGFDHTRFEGGVWPTRDGLDRVAPLHPVFLRRVDGHAALVNTAALNLAGIGQETPDPQGGALLRDHDGNPTGILLERAMEPVLRLLPPVPLELREAALRFALVEAARGGFTAVTDHGGDADALLALAADPALPRVALVASLDLDLERLRATRERFAQTGGRLVLLGAGTVLDGILAVRTAALREPYADAPTVRGMLFQPPAALAHRVQAAAAAGFAVVLEASGDAAARLALDAFAAAREAGADGTLRLEASALLAAGDVRRAAELGVIVSCQPARLLADRRIARARLGPDRLDDLHRLQSLRAAGCALVLGTGFPATPQDALTTLHLAVLRRLPGEPEASAFRPDERIPYAAAVAALTATGAEGELAGVQPGPLAAGAPADLVVLDGFDRGGRVGTPVTVWWTLVGGRTAFGGP